MHWKLKKKSEDVSRLCCIYREKNENVEKRMSGDPNVWIIEEKKMWK